MIKVIIADDHQMMLDGVVSILTYESDIEIIGTATNGIDALELLENNEVDIAILDIEMPGKSGVEVAEIIHKKYPQTQVLMLTMHGSKEFVKKIISIGAKGYILKNNGFEELVNAIRTLSQGKSYYGSEIVDVILQTFKEKDLNKPIDRIMLTKREKEILIKISEGKSSVQISKELMISPSTVNSHRSNLIDKTGVKNSKELIIFALENKSLM